MHGRGLRIAEQQDSEETDNGPHGKFRESAGRRNRGDSGLQLTAELLVEAGPGALRRWPWNAG